MHIPYEDMTNAARRAVEHGQRRATERRDTHTNPEHLLLAILDDAGSLAYQALTAIGILPGIVAAHLTGQLTSDGNSAAPAPLSYDSELIIHFASKEAYQLGHRQLDALHLLLGIFYLGRGVAYETLRSAGVRLVDLRQFLLARPELARGLRVDRDDQLRHILRPSPIFVGVIGVVVASGLALCVGVPERYIGALTLLFVISGWVVSLCVHEFGHALAAFVGGDRSVRDKGYLTLDPRRYAHPFLSIVMPLVFLLPGGIGLPGGAVYIDRGKLRSARWESFVAAAGPLGTLACTLLTTIPFLLPWRGWVTPQNEAFWSALAYLAFIQMTAIVFNSLPIPGLDGFGIIAPSLPEEWQQATLRLGFLPMTLLYVVLWQDTPIRDAFWYRIFDLADTLRIPIRLVFDAMDRFPF